MNNLLKRIATGLVAAALVVSLTIWSGTGLWIVLLAVSLIGLHEYLHMVQAVRSYRFLSLGLAALVWAGWLYGYLSGTSPEQWMWRILLGVFPVLSLAVLFNPAEKQPIANLGALILGWVYWLVPFLLFFEMAHPDGAYDFRIPLCMLFLTWFLDSFAYFGGRLYGRRPFFPRISPKKTWEGTLTGMAACMGLAAVFANWQATSEGIGFSWWIVGGIIALLGQPGDLVESMFKRSAQVKDSGTILPGHGGMLDRFDAFSLCIPVVYCYLYWAG